VVTDLNETSTILPAMDISEYENEFVAVAELPGVKKDDVKITLEKNVLTVQGQRKPYEIQQDARIHLNEMRMRDFSRSIQIPSEIDANNISAELENGVLRIVLPKAQDARVRTIQIK
jgi:HSP20 family protein